MNTSNNLTNNHAVNQYQNNYQNNISFPSVSSMSDSERRSVCDKIHQLSEEIKRFKTQDNYMNDVRYLSARGNYNCLVASEYASALEIIKQQKKELETQLEKVSKDLLSERKFNEMIRIQAIQNEKILNDEWEKKIKEVSEISSNTLRQVVKERDYHINTKEILLNKKRKLSKENNFILNEIEKLEKHSDRLKDELDEKKAELKKIQEEVIQKQKLVKELNEQNQSQHKLMLTQAEEVQIKLLQKEEKLKKAQEELLNVQKDLTEAKTINQDLHIQNLSQETLFNMEIEKAKMDAISEKEFELQKTRTELTKSQKLLEELQKQNQPKSRKRKACTNDNAALDETVKKLKNAADISRDAQNKVQAENQDLKNQIKFLKNENEKLTNAMETIKQERNNLQNGTKNLRSEALRLEDENSALHKNLKKTKSQLEQNKKDFNQQLISIENTIVMLKKELEEVKNQNKNKAGFVEFL